MWLPDLTLQLIAFRVLAFLIIAGALGGVVAGAAVLLGDKRPKYDGRLTVVPTGHMDLVGTIILILFGFGWIRPVSIDAAQFRVGQIVGIVAVILAGFLCLNVIAALLEALVLPALTTLPHTAALTTAAFLRTASELSIWFALFNLVPIPPLTGGLLFEAFGVSVSRQLKWVLAAVLSVAVAAGTVRQFLGPAHAVLASVILGQ